MNSTELKEVYPWDYKKRMHTVNHEAHDALYQDAIKALRPVMQKWCDKHYSMTDVDIVIAEAGAHLRNEMNYKRDNPTNKH